MGNNPGNPDPDPDWDVSIARQGMDFVGLLKRLCEQFGEAKAYRSCPQNGGSQGLGVGSGDGKGGEFGEMGGADAAELNMDGPAVVGYWRKLTWLRKWYVSVVGGEVPAGDQGVVGGELLDSPLLGDVGGQQDEPWLGLIGQDEFVSWMDGGDLF
jgi:hypothetical protein